MPKVILVANTDWYLYNFRFSLIKTLQEKGFTPVLVSPMGRFVEIFREQGWEHHEWQVGRQSVLPWQEIPSVKQLQNIYQRVQPDLVHHHTNKAVLYGTMAARKFNIPVINSIPGTGYVFSSPTLKARLLKPITEGMFNLYLTPYQKQQMIFENRGEMAYFIKKKFIPGEKAILIPSVGVNLSKYDGTAPKPTDKPVIAFIGRMLWGKGVGVFADAAKILKEKKVNCRMVLIGLPDFDNPDFVPTEILQNWQEQGILEWWGWREDMPATYQVIDILAQPTQYGEGVPTTLIEASASRRAVIATDWPSCREVIKHGQTGLLVRPGDAADLADKISELVDNPQQRNNLAENAYALVSNKFSTEHVNEETLGVYERVMGNI
ncbi:MAG: glycosyltransferase family 4 protein [Anaerolineaceae bacterium]|nr:glycosyltransferase family 4 protein [Anaerolineaceae bacterium]